MALYKKSSFNYDRVGMDAYLDLDTARAHMEREQQMLQRQMRQMQDMMQQQMYPMYQMQEAPRATTSSTATTNTSGWETIYRADFKESPMAPPERYEKPKCASCGENAHRQNNLTKGADCDRTKGLKKQQQIRNFRKLYWHRRAKNPELFETKHD